MRTLKGLVQSVPISEVSSVPRFRVQCGHTVCHPLSIFTLSAKIECSLPYLPLLFKDGRTGFNGVVLIIGTVHITYNALFCILRPHRYNIKQHIATCDAN